MATGKTDFSSQQSALRRDLTVVARQIELEQQRRSEVESLLDIERGQDKGGIQEHVDVLLKRDEELRQVKVEKDQMTNYLKLGIDEAQRLSFEIVELQKQVAEQNALKETARQELWQYQDGQKRLEMIVDEMRQKSRHLAGQKKIYQENADRRSNLTHTTHGSIRETETYLESIKDELDQVKRRHADKESLSTATSMLSAAIRRAHFDLKELDAAADRGTLTEMDEENVHYDEEEDGDGTIIPSQIMNKCRPTIHSSDHLNEDLRTKLKNYHETHGDTTMQMLKNLNIEMEEAEQSNDDLSKKIVDELKEWNDLLKARENFLMRVEQLKREAEAGEHPQAMVDGQFSLTAYFNAENPGLQNELVELEQMSLRQASKNRSLEDDYAVVKQLRREYRGLEKQKRDHEEQIQEYDFENTDIKFALREIGFSQQQKNAKKTAAQEKPAWKSTVQDGSLAYSHNGTFA